MCNACIISIFEANHSCILKVNVSYSILWADKIIIIIIFLSDLCEFCIMLLKSNKVKLCWGQNQSIMVRYICKEQSQYESCMNFYTCLRIFLIIPLSSSKIWVCITTTGMGTQEIAKWILKKKIWKQTSKYTHADTLIQKHDCPSLCFNLVLKGVWALKREYKHISFPSAWWHFITGILQ